jgi:putative heme-binding domain-containing protein
MQTIPHRSVWLLAWLALGISQGRASWADDPRSHPHPVIAWPAGPFEVRVAFDKPLDASVAEKAVGRLIPFEVEDVVPLQAKPKSERPGRIVPDSRRGTLRIASARLDEGGRSLHLVTDPQPRVATYSLHLTGVRVPGQTAAGEAIDLLYGLGGVEAVWDEGKDDGSEPTWSGWWPDLDPVVVERLMRGSVAHERSLALLSRPGRLVLSTNVVLQEGRATLRLVSGGPIEAIIGGENAVAVDEPDGGQRVEFPVNSTGEAIDLTVTLRTGTGKGPTRLRATLKKEGKPGEDPLPRERLLVPWASPTPRLPTEPPTLPGGIAGGDRARGELIFFGEQARCSACHAIGGKGGNVGPDLGHQFERPPAEVFRDLADPGAWINPNYVAYTVALKDGRILVGIVRAEGADAIRVTDTDAKATVVPRAEIEEFRPCATSIMPVGLVGTLGEGALRDLLAFLTHPPASPRP